MFNFFAQENMREGDRYLINGGDYNHIKNVLRMKTGDVFLVSENGKSHLCEIEKIVPNCKHAFVSKQNSISKNKKLTP